VESNGGFSVDRHANWCRRIRRQKLLALTLAPALAALSFVLSILLAHIVEPNWFLLPALFGMAISFYFALKYTKAICPRCNQPFFIRGVVAANAFAWKCAHCGFALRSPDGKEDGDGKGDAAAFAGEARTEESEQGK